MLTLFRFVTFDRCKDTNFFNIVKKYCSVWPNFSSNQQYGTTIERFVSTSLLQSHYLCAQKKQQSFANGHLYYGLHRLCDRSWVFREWLPNAERVVLIGDFNGWKEEEGFALKRINAGRRVWREAACLVPTCGTGFAHDAILSSGLVSGSTLPIQGENLLSLSGTVANL